MDCNDDCEPVMMCMDGVLSLSSGVGLHMHDVTVRRVIALPAVHNERAPFYCSTRNG